MIRIFKKNKKSLNYYSKGSLLLELLIMVSVIVVILSFSANAMFLSMKGNKISGDRDVAMSLASESLEATRSVVEEDWQNIYSLSKGGEHYYPSQSGNKWIISSGDGSITLNNIAYTRYITIENVCRDDNTRDITGVSPCNTGSSDDPSTQYITSKVSWSNTESTTVGEYFFRWKNKTCSQSGWLNGGSGDAIKNCSDTSYDTKDSIDITGGTLKIQ